MLRHLRKDSQSPPERKCEGGPEPFKLGNRPQRFFGRLGLFDSVESLKKKRPDFIVGHARDHRIDFAGSHRLFRSLGFGLGSKRPGSQKNQNY